MSKSVLTPYAAIPMPFFLVIPVPDTGIQGRLVQEAYIQKPTRAGGANQPEEKLNQD